MRVNPHDSADRQQALDIGRSFIVKAPAGSGKTTLLVKRYLKLLAVVNHPEEIIAITFTRKAAGELIARVMSALSEEPAKNTDGFSDHELIDIARRARQRDQSEGWQLIGNPSKLRIQTIDSLCNYIVRQMPWSAGFGAAPSSVGDDVSRLYLQAARQALVNALSSDSYRVRAENVLTALENDFSRTCELIQAMLAKRDQWHGLISRHKDENPRQQLEANWAYAAEHVLDNCLKNISPADQNQLAELCRYAANNLIDLNIESPIVVLQYLDNLPATDVGQIATWKAIAALLLTRDLKFRKTANVNTGFPPLSKGGVKGKKEEFVAVLARLREDNLESAFVPIAMLPDSAYSDTEWQLLDSLLCLLRLAQIELLDIFQQQGCCDHIEIASRSIVALSQDQGDGPSELALRLDYAIKHLLVDEFQDTSQSQMLLLNRLTAGWQAGDRRTVFFVGDPMQSIYRFRQADVGLFLNVFNNGFENTDIKALTLTTNFRSSKPIVDWVNKTFVQIFPDHDDMQFGAVRYVDSSAYKIDAGHTDGQTTHVVKKQDEATQICRLIDKISRQSPNATIAVLVRGRTHLADIVIELQNFAIAYQGIKIEQLKNRSCIQDIQALTSALLHFGDKLAWLAVLRAPWCGLSLPDLTLIAQHAGNNNTVWQVSKSPPGQLSEAGLTRLDRLVKLLTPVLECVGRQPLNHVVARAWYALSGPETIDPGELINVKTCMELLGEIQQAGRLADLTQLETAMEDLWAVTGNNGSQVQLMTIHMAKGLEYDVVIVPGLARRPRVDDSKLLIWKEFVVSNQRSALLVSPIRQNDDDERYKFVQSLEKQSEREEIKRLLYVAATRAKSQLHLFMAPINTKTADSENNTGTTLQSLLEPVLKPDKPFESETVQITAAESETRAVKQKYYRLPLNHKPKSAVERLGLAVNESGNDLVEYEWVGVSARHEGTLMHEIICRMANGSFINQASAKKRWYNQLLSFGLHPQQIKKSIAKIKSTVDHMTHDARARWILDNTHSDPKNEWSISAVVNGRLENIIIDRTFKDEHGVRWIIDYKTSTHEGANVQAFLDSEFERYRPQLENYAAILRLSELNPIKLGLYFPLLKAWREWDYVG